jgi:hypothetical protein
MGWLRLLWSSRVHARRLRLRGRLCPTSRALGDLREGSGVGGAVTAVAIAEGLRPGGSNGISTPRRDALVDHGAGS